MTINEIRQIFNEKLESLNWNIEPLGLYSPIDYVLSLGGKRIRPVSVLLASQLFDNDAEKALYPALAIEVFHNFTLLHDDIMDKADKRRNQPTVHIKWDENTAILSGDAMMIKAYQLLTKCEPQVLKPILDVFSQTSLEVCEGQQYDMEFENRANVTISEYVNMIRLKTAVLLASSLKIGALCGGASDKDADLLYEFGIGIGIAFQLKDDLLDVYGNSQKFGKNIGGDIVSNKKTYMLIKAMDLADSSVRTELLEWINNNKESERADKVKAVTAIYDKLDIKKYVEKVMLDYYNGAIGALKNVSVSEEKKIVSFLNEPRKVI